MQCSEPNQRKASQSPAPHFWDWDEDLDAVGRWEFGGSSNKIEHVVWFRVSVNPSRAAGRLGMAVMKERNQG